MAHKENGKKGRPAKAARRKVKTYHHGDLKNALLDSSVALLREHGPQAFSLRELALAVGVSSAAPYRHFKTKERLFAALAERGFVLLSEGFRTAIQTSSKDPLEQLHSVGVSYYEFAVKYPEHLQMMFGNIIPPEQIAQDAVLGAAAGQAFGLLTEVVQKCQNAGALAAGEDPKMLAILMWSSIHGFASLDSYGTLQGASRLTYDPKKIAVRISKAMAAGLNTK